MLLLVRPAKPIQFIKPFKRRAHCAPVQPTKRAPQPNEHSCCWCGIRASGTGRSSSARANRFPCVYAHASRSWCGIRASRTGRSSSARANRFPCVYAHASRSWCGMKASRTERSSSARANGFPCVYAHASRS